MPKKTIELTGEVDVDHSLIDGEGFPKIDKAVSRSTAYRLGKNGQKVDCDPACNIKGRRVMGEYLRATHGKYGSEKAVSRLEQNSLGFVQFGKDHFYCSDSVDYYIKHIHEPNVRKTKIENLKTDSEFKWTRQE